LNAALGEIAPALDFAGGTVVHISSGGSALICALYLDKRLDTSDNTPRNIVPSIVEFVCMVPLVRVQCRKRAFIRLLMKETAGNDRKRLK